MMKLCVAAATVITATALPAVAQKLSQPLFEVTDVNRDTVPAGTPEAFWAAFGPSPKNESTREVDGTNYLYVPLAQIPLAGGKIALVSTGASSCDGHACSGLNSVHYLKRDTHTGRYKVEGEWLDVGATGTFGNPALGWAVTDAITEAPVLYTDAGGVWQGHACSYAVLTELTDAGPVQIATIPTYYSNGGAVETGATELKGTITAAQMGNSFTVSYTGTKSFSERYRRGADGRYKISSKSRVPTC